MAEGHTDQSETGINEALRCCRCSQWPDKPGLLLACLHSCCARCTDEALARGDGVHVFCPHCDEETEVVEKDLSSSSSLAVQASSPEESGTLVVCDFCPEPAQSHSRAEYWCADCRSHLCGACKPGHDRFQRSHKDVTPLTESLIADSLPVLRMRGALTCRRHDLRYDHVCSTCGGALKCLECGKECTKSCHDISIVTDEDASLAADELERLAGSVAGSASALGSRRLALQQELAADLRDLMARKRHIAKVLEEAFGAARDALEETYGEAMAQHERLTKRAACALWRQSSLTSCRHSEPTDFLAHSRHVRDRLRHLSDEAAAAARGGTGPSIAVRASTLPDNLMDMMKSWIGLPVLLGSEGLPQASTEGASIDIMCPCVIGSAAGTGQQQHLWKDVAVTCCGHLLLAAGKSGLQECDTRGRCLSSWPAPAVAAAAALGAAAGAAERQEEVIAVDALEDDRAVVGLKFAMTAVLLERDGGLSTCSWHELRRFDLLLRGQSIPFALSARAGLVVVACGTLGDCNRLCPGPAVATFRVSDGRRLHNAELKYAVYGLAVTEQAVVVASYGKVKVDATRERYVVESLDLDLQQSRWVIDFDRRVWDVATSPSGRVLYAAVTDCSTGMVTAIKADDGRLLADDVSMAAAPGASGSSAVPGGGSSCSGGNVAGGSCVFFRSVSDGISLSPNGAGSSSGGGGSSTGSSSSGGMSGIGDGSSSCAASSSRCFTQSYHQVRLPSRLSVDKVGNSWLATLSLDSKTVSVIDARFLDGMECRWLSVAQSI